MRFNGGTLVVQQLRAAGVERVFCVPGESYLAVMDALYDVREHIDLISCRHEGGAAMMAVASGHLTGRPGVAFVTRGPGATNASIAVHIAQQASLPLVLGVGQVARANLGRDAFQEVDFEAYFSPIAKAVQQVDDADALPEVFADAFARAAHGRQGPVIVALPEDILSGPATAQPAAARISLSEDALDGEPISRAVSLFDKAQRPVVIVGGGPWETAACEQLRDFVETRDVPVLSAFRRADIFDNHHPSYAGFLGYGAPDSSWKTLADADCVLALGSRLDEPSTRNYEFPRADQPSIHVHPEARQLGLNFDTAVPIHANVKEAIRALADVASDRITPSRAWREAARAAFLASQEAPPADGVLDLGAVMQRFNELAPADCIVTTDAGNHTAWPLRYRRYARPGRLIAPINGAMGYGVPAAVAASLALPQRCVVAFVGDGGMLMTGMEIATAIKYGACPIILVFNNAKFGTIEMHQQRTYPGRPIGNALSNPDFTALAQSFGAWSARVKRTDEFADAFVAARAAGRVAVIELLMDDPARA